MFTLPVFVADTDAYAVIGDPISHSLSPQIHRAFAAQTAQRLDYQAVRVAAGNVAEFLAAFAAAGGRGCSVTLPLKQEAYAACSQHSVCARAATAANALWRNAAGEWCADNTDGVGLVHDLQRLIGGVRDRRILIAGAGGAARGIVPALMAAHPASITLTNRTPARAQSLCQELLQHTPASGCVLQAVTCAELPALQFDLIINATAASLSGELPALPREIVSTHTAIYDLMYAREPTVFMRWGQDAGAGIVADGLGMLVEQAAEAFALWRGVRPDTRAVYAQLRASAQ